MARDTRGKNPKFYSTKLDAPVGTTAQVSWPDVTSWCHSGWALKEAKPGYAVLVRVKKV